MTTSRQFPDCVAYYDPNALPVSAAQEIVRQWAAPRGHAPSERVSLFDALDRVLAEDVISPIDVPSHDNSAMDGYAFAGASLGGVRELSMTVAGTALAGRPFLDTPGATQCVRIMTGALIPPGCDTVVPQESVSREGDTIRFATDALQPGQNRRLAGEDLARGRPALRAGRIVRASDLGLLASLGIAEVAVRRRLRVAFFSTGDELRSVGEELTAGSVYDSNRYTLFAMLRRLNVEPIDLGIVRDDRASLEKALRHATETADVVISSGGVSVGDADFTRELMNSLGDVAFWKIAMRPGRPLAFGRLWSGPRAGEGESALFFGLPGQSGRGDGDVLFHRARGFARPVGRDARGALHDPRDEHRADQEARRPHRIPARHREPRRRRTFPRRDDGPARFRRAEFDERGELFHRART